MKIENLNKAARIARQMNLAKGLVKHLRSVHMGEESLTHEVTLRYEDSSYALIISVATAIQIAEEQIEKLTKEVEAL